MLPHSTEATSKLLSQEEFVEKAAVDKPVESENPPRMRSNTPPNGKVLAQEWEISAAPDKVAADGQGRHAVAPDAWLKAGNQALEAGLQELQKSHPNLDQDALIQKFMQQFGQELIENFDRLDFNSSADKLTFARHFAKAQPELCAEHFTLFDLTEEDQKLEIARECKPFSIIHRANFALSDAVLFTLACEVAHEESGAIVVGALISDLNLPQESQRIKLAHICVKSFGLALATNIEKFDIRSEDERLKLCLIYFKGENTANLDYLEDFGLTTCGNRKQAAFAASDLFNNEAQFKLLNKYLLDSKPTEIGLTIAIEFLIHFSSYDSMRKILSTEFNSLQKKTRTSQLSSASMFYLQSKPDFQTNIQRKKDELALHLFRHLRSGPVVLENAFSISMEEMLTTLEPFELMELLVWMRDVCFLILERQLNAPQFLEKLRPVLTEIMSLQDKNYRTVLIERLFSLTPAQIANFNPAGLNTSTYLPALLMEPIATPSLSAYLRSAPASIFGDGKNQRKFIECVLALQTSLLPAKRIQHILLNVFPDTPVTIRYPNSLLKPDNLNKLANTRKILAFDTPANNREKPIVKSKAVSLTEFESTLRALTKIRTLVEIDEELALDVAGNTPALIADEIALDDAIRKIVVNSLKLSESDYLKFATIFYAYREPVTLLTYLGRIRHLPALETLRKFISNTLAGNFPASRYQADALLEKCTPELREAWQIRGEAPFLINGQIKPKWKLAFTDDHQDLLRMGSDVRGSCQRVDGEAYLNRGLIGNVMDGKQKICVLKNEEGKIVGRAILRLMSTSDLAAGDSPCLLMEKIYPVTLRAGEEKAILDFAIAQAKRLGLPLAISTDVTPPAALPAMGAGQILYSGALAYPVYCDALNGMQEQGFKIKAHGDKPLSWLYQPTS